MSSVLRRRALVALAAAAVVVAGALSSGAAAGADGPRAAPPETLEVQPAKWSGPYADSLLAQGLPLDENPFAVLVSFRADAVPADVLRLLDAIGAEIVAEHAADDGASVHVVETLAGVDRTLEHLRTSDLVLQASPDTVLRSSAVANIFDWGRHLSADSLTQYQWGLDTGAGVDAVPAWAAASGADEVVVGVIDGGIDLSHPDLVDMIWTNPGEIADNGIDDDDNGYVDDVHGWDFAFDDNDPSAESTHGVHVAGIIGAERDNNEGIAGVAANVKIAPLRYSNGFGWGFTSDAMEALAYALDNDIPITNNSYGGSGHSWVFEAMLADNPQHLFVAAAGNDAQNYDEALFYPGGYGSANVLNIASHEYTGALSVWSGRGLDGVDASAPGGSIHSTKVGGYTTMTGTSMAAPHAAGIAAMVLGVDPTLTPAEIIALMLDTSRWHDASVIDAVRSGGHLDAGRAVRAADPLAPSVVLGSVPASVMTGSTLSLSVTATGTGGDLTDDVVWYVESADGAHDGSVVGTGPSVDVVVAADGRLRVRAEVTDGSGRWGLDVAIVTAVAAPSAPREVEAEAGDEAIVVAWVAPLSPGTSPIDGYVAIASPGGASCATGSTSCVIDGLTNGVTYSVTVHAHSAVGDGAVAGPVGPLVPASVPSLPLSPAVTAGDRSIRVSWAPPVDDGGLGLDGYAVTIEPAGASCEVGAEVTSCGFAELPNGEAQTVTLIARNSLGDSAPLTAVVVPSVVATACDDPPPTTFSDVAASSFASTDVACLRTLGVTNGTSATTYSPAAPVTREQMAAFLSRLFREVTGRTCAPIDASPFVDVPATSFAAADVDCLRALRVTTGTSPTTYSPGQLVTREQMAAFLARLYRSITGASCSPADPSPFVDVAATSFAVVDVECLRLLGVTNGTSPTTYGPEQVVTREQMAAFLGRLYRALVGA